jgi:hypothetical protein
MNLGMDRETSRRWRAAHTLADYGELTAQWLEGRIPSQPGYQPNCGPDDETLPHVEVLAAINRAGYITDCSQPGIDCIGYDHARWRQRAAVTGFMQMESQAVDLLRRLDRAGIAGIGLKPLNERCGKFGGIEVTRRKRKGYTWFGGPRDYDEIMAFNGGSPRVVHRLWFDCFEVVAYDPEWGRNDRLWPVLADFATAWKA